MSLTDLKQRPSRYGRTIRTSRFIVGCLVVLGLAAGARGEDSDLAKQLQEKGFAITETKGVGTTVTIKDCTKLSEADFTQIGKLPHVKSISLGSGINDASMALLSGLTEVEMCGSNGMQLTDEGIKPMAQWKKLRSVAFFHPGLSFSGKGLVYLAECPDLERLTVAGSPAFGDEGMAAVGKLTQLKEFRSWHSGFTLDGVKSLGTLKGLKSLNLGQRLANKPPVSISNETLPVLAEMASLEALQLGEARLSLAALRELKHLPQLKKLTLDGIQLPAADVDLLKKELPKVEIKWTEPSEAYKKRILQLFGAE